MALSPMPKKFPVAPSKIGVQSNMRFGSAHLTNVIGDLWIMAMPKVFARVSTNFGKKPKTVQKVEIAPESVIGRAAVKFFGKLRQILDPTSHSIPANGIKDPGITISFASIWTSSGSIKYLLYLRGPSILRTFAPPV